MANFTWPSTSGNPRAIWRPLPAPSLRRQRSTFHAVFTGGPRHRQTYEVGGSPAPMITVPSPEGTHAYERTSYDEAALVARYKHVGIIEGSDEPDEIGLQLVSALATIAAHVESATALSPGSIMLPEHVFPGVRSVMGLEVVRGDRVALLLELFQPPVDDGS